MRTSRYPVLYLTFLFILIWSGCKSEMLPEDNPQNDVVAKYDGKYTVTFSELSKYVNDWFYSHKFKDKSVAYNNALNDLLINQFKRMDFFEKGLDKNEKLIQSISRTINEELVSEYFNKKYLDKYANMEEAKKVYNIMDKQVIAQQIVLYKPENASPTQIDSIQQKAMKIKSEIEEGKDFNSLVRQYSQDAQSLKNNGFMPPVDWKQSMIDPVGNVLFGLNNGDVRVLNALGDFKVVKIDEVKKIHVEPFDKIKNEIISFLKNAYYQVSMDEYEKDKKVLIDENSLEWNEEALKQLVKWSNEPNFYGSRYQKTFEDALANNDNKTILVYNKGKVDYKEYLRLLNNILILPSAQNNLTEKDLKDFILEAIRTDMIVDKANSLDLKKYIFNPFTKNVVLKNRIAYLYNQAEIETKIPDTTYEALHQFFNENENTLYYQLAKRNIFVMVFPNKDEAENASKKIKQGIPFEKVKGSYLVRTYLKERNGEIKTFPNDEKPVFAEIAFKMKQSEVSAPIKFKDENNQIKYAILKCYYIRPEKQLTFDDVKNSIANDFRNYYREKISKDVEQKLKDKYHPEIFEDVLTKALSSN